MQKWQTPYPEARPDRLDMLRGQRIFAGYYLWEEKHNQPVSPTVVAADTFAGHEYLNEV